MRTSTFHAHDKQSDEHDDSGPSKSQRKRDMQALQELGEQLARLPAARINALDVPDALRDALRVWLTLPSFEGRRRHAQYIGKLMRKVDPEPLRQALLDATGDSRAAVARMHLVEDWRQRLLDSDDALGQLLPSLPDASPQELRQLVRAARAEQAAGKPPKHFRALYQTLKQLFEQHDRDAQAGDEADAHSDDPHHEHD